MAYKAKVNDSETFFDTSDLDNNQHLLTAALLDMAANSSGIFTFTIPSVNPARDNFNQMIDYIDVYRDDDIIFSGRVFGISELFNMSRKITVEGMMAVLGDSIYRPTIFDGTLHNLLADIISSHNSQVEAQKQISIGTITVLDEPVYREYELYETSLSRIRDLVESYGGYMLLRKTTTGLVLDWLDEFTTASTQSINFKSNIIDLTQEQDSEKICTVCIPLGATQEDGTRLTIKSVNSGLDYLEAPSLFIERYGRIVKTVVFDDITIASNLKQKGTVWMYRALVPEVTINVTAIDLADAGVEVDAFRIGQKISVTSEPNGLENEFFDVTAQTLDLLHPAQNKLILGTGKLGYIEKQRRSQSEFESVLKSAVNQSQLQAAVNDLTEYLNGNEGGFMVRLDTDHDGKIDEVLFMDTPDISTAVNVWRFNMSGWGRSTSGYAGPYTLGASIDGGILGSFIVALSITADKIAAGAITIGKLSSAAQSAIVKGVSAKTQYYISDSSTALSGGSWSDTPAAWSSGKYIWTRQVVTKTFLDDSTDTTEGAAIYDQNLTTARSTAETSYAVQYETVETIYYRSTTSTTPSLTASTTIYTTDDTSNRWTYVMPVPKPGCYYFTAMRYVQRGGNVAVSSVRKLSNANYVANWANATDQTKIDGANIYTGTVAAGAIEAGGVFTQQLEAQNLKVTGGSFQIEASSNTQSYIDIYRNLTSGSGLRTQVSAQQIAKRGYYNGEEWTHSLLSSTSLQVEDVKNNKKSGVYTEYVETPRVKVTDGMFKDVEYSKSVTIAANSYVETYEPIAADTDYEISGFGGYYLSYGSQVHVYRASINPARTRFYYGLKNWASSATTTTLYYDVFMAKTQ